MEPTEPPNEEPRSCQAITWNTGSPCGRRIAPGADVCAAQLALNPPDYWWTSGYVAFLNPADRSLFGHARFRDLSDELAIARLQLRNLLAAGAEAKQILPVLDAIAKLVKLRSQLDEDRSRWR